MFRRIQFALLTAVWIGAIGFGLNALMAYKARPGPSGKTPSVWPRNQALALAKDKPVLVMFAHPRCPCTKASIAELELLAARAQGRFEAIVAFYEPQTDSVEWTNSATMKAARGIPGVRVITDTNGRLAKEFGAETSGHTVVYSSTGKLLFSGGITGSRGHVGDNTAFDSVLQIVQNSGVPARPAFSKVFGCGLFDRCTTKQITN